MEIKYSFVHLDNLTKIFGTVTAVDSISLSISQGEFITLLGPSGSGKTTTLMMVAGFEVPNAGEIYIKGEPMTYRAPHKRDIGMVFQSYALFPHMTVYDNIAYPLKNRKVAKVEIEQKVKSALDLVKLTGMGDRYSRQLSGGQQQRVALARALVFNPSLLLMDEPLGALDKKLREHMQLEIKRIQEKLGITIMYVTHDQSEALTMSDRIAVMNGGRIEQLGSPSELYEEPENSFVADFVGESNFLDGKIVEAKEQSYEIQGEAKLRFSVKTHKPLSIDDRARVALRPEKLFFVDEGKKIQNYFSGTIQAIVYVGDFTKYEIKLDENGQLLILKEQNRSGFSRHRRGNKVWIGWLPEDGKVVELL